MGLSKDMKLKGNDFSNTATAFFAAYLIAGIPTGLFNHRELVETTLTVSRTVYILNKVSAGKWLAINMVLWGIACACTAAAHNYSALLAARIFLVSKLPLHLVFHLLAVNGIPNPSKDLVSHSGIVDLERARLSAASYLLPSSVSSMLSLRDGKYCSLSWEILLFLGLVSFFVIPEAPMTAKFMSVVERAAILDRVSVNRTGVLNRHFKASHILEALLDVPLWLLALMTILVSNYPSPSPRIVQFKH
jgi:hypothetical protein